MDFNFRACYNLDVLNLLSILTGDPIYTEKHPDVFQEFSMLLSQESQNVLKLVRDALGSGMISPPVAFVISFIPNFEEADLVALLMDEERILSDLEIHEPRIVAHAENLLPLFRLLAPVIEEVENLDFNEYWTSQSIPAIILKRDELQRFTKNVSLIEETSAFLDKRHQIDPMTIYLCAFAAPYAIKVSGKRYITDVSYSKEIIFGKALHEMFHMTLDHESLGDLFDQLADDPFIRLAFERKDPRYGFPEMNGYLEENIVEAMTLYICHKTALEPDPFTYLLHHDGGSHVFSVILLDYMQRVPKLEGSSFSEYLISLVKKMPHGNLANAYQKALENAGKNLTI